MSVNFYVDKIVLNFVQKAYRYGFGSELIVQNKKQTMGCVMRAVEGQT